MKSPYPSSRSTYLAATQVQRGQVTVIKQRINYTVNENRRRVDVQSGETNFLSGRAVDTLFCQIICPCCVNTALTAVSPRAALIADRATAGADSCCAGMERWIAIEVNGPLPRALPPPFAHRSRLAPGSCCWPPLLMHQHHASSPPLPNEHLFAAPYADTIVFLAEPVCLSSSSRTSIIVRHHHRRIKPAALCR